MGDDDKIRISWDDIAAAKSAPPKPSPAAPPNREPQDPAPGPAAADGWNKAQAPPTPPRQQQPAAAAPALRSDKGVDTIQRDLPQVMTANKRVAGQLCAVCQSKIAVGDQVRNCEKCLLSYHLECWEENKGCATYGCPNAPGKESQMGEPEIRVDFGPDAGARSRVRTVAPPPPPASAPPGRNRPIVEFGSALCRCGTLIPPNVQRCQSCGQPRPGVIPQAAPDPGPPTPPLHQGLPQPPVQGFAPQQQPVASSRVARETLRVGFGPRFAAMFLDGVYMAAIWLVFGLIMGRGGSFLWDGPAGLGDAARNPMVVWCVLYWLVEALTGASLGKRTLGLIVSRPDGRSGDVALWIKRTCLKNAANIMSLAVVLTGVTALEPVYNIAVIVVFLGAFAVFGPSRQALHDIIAGSAVFYRRDIL